MPSGLPCIVTALGNPACRSHFKELFVSVHAMSFVALQTHNPCPTTGVLPNA